jgi:hypothetical protein
MFYKRRELRRLWEVEVFDGDPHDKDTAVYKTTIIAWNAVDAIRHAGSAVAKQPIALYYVTWPDKPGGPVYRINSTAGGPVGDPVVPSVSRDELSQEDWQ